MNLANHLCFVKPSKLILTINNFIDNLLVCLAASVSRRESVNSWYEERLHLILDQFPEAQQHTIIGAMGSGISHWLTTFPLEHYHFDLAPIEFRDALALRYLWTPPGLPSRCDGCGESFTLQHGLDCPKGGLIIRRHNEIRDCLGDMAALVWPQVIWEPVVREAGAKKLLFSVSPILYLLMFMATCQGNSLIIPIRLISTG